MRGKLVVSFLGGKAGRQGVGALSRILLPLGYGSVITFNVGVCRREAGGVKRLEIA